jgi:hypothetical protein
VALLPPELWDHVLSLLPANELQSTALALTRALPLAHVSHALLWRFLHLTREGQSLQAISKLRELPGFAEAVRSISLGVWRQVFGPAQRCSSSDLEGRVESETDLIAVPQRRPPAHPQLPSAPSQAQLAPPLNRAAVQCRAFRGAARSAAMEQSNRKSLASVQPLHDSAELLHLPQGQFATRPNCSAMAESSAEVLINRRAVC